MQTHITEDGNFLSYCLNKVDFFLELVRTRDRNLTHLLIILSDTLKATCNNKNDLKIVVYETQ